MLGVNCGTSPPETIPQPTRFARTIGALGALFLAAALIVSGCETSGGGDPEDLPAVTQTAAETSSAPSSNPYDHPDYRSGDIANKENALWPDPPLNDDPNQLMGLDRLRLDGLLGQPTLVREEATAEIWQYQTPSCVLDVFLYESTGVSRVTYVEARDREAQDFDTRLCLRRLLRARTDTTTLG